MNEIETVRNEVLPIPDQARMILVTDKGSLSMANEFFLTIKALRKKIADTFDPIIKKAHEAHQEALKQKKAVEEPLVVAEKYLNGQVTTYTLEQERLRHEEEERLRQEALKAEAERRAQEEAEKIQAAADLEAQGEHEQAEALMQEALEVKEAPIEITPPPPKTEAVKLTGATVKDYWKCEVVNLKELCKAIVAGQVAVNCVEPNMTVLNGLARSLKKEMSIPGCKAICTSSMAATGRNRAA